MGASVAGSGNAAMRVADSGTTAMHMPRTRTRRRISDYVGWGLTTLAFLLLGGAMLSILVMVFLRGFKAINWTVVTQVTQGVGGGLLNAIEGSAVLAVGGVVLAVPVGMAAGIYVAEFDHGWLAPTVRFLSDVLVGVPSIVVGYFGYVTMVVMLGWNFSVAAGSIALAIIALPYISRTTEMAMRQVPREMREGAYALGARDGTVIMMVCLPSALPGVLTGVLLALAIAVGETAPLLYTAGWSQYMWNGHLTNSPIGYLTYAIWAFFSEPYASAHALAYAAAFFVTLFVLLISVASRVLLDRNTGRRRRR